MLGAWRALKLSLSEVLVASNANVGGPATAASLAVGQGWSTLVVPGMLVGNLGNAMATFIGLGLGKWVYQGFIVSAAAAVAGGVVP